MDQKQNLSTGMFHMWRGLLAIAWADGSCGAEETAYFSKVFDNLPRYYNLTQEQRDALAHDLEHPGKIDDILPRINEPEARSLLLRYAEDLAVLDGVLDPAEEDILKKLHLARDPGIDYAALQAEIHQLVLDRRAERAREKEQLRREIQDMHPLYKAIDRLLLKLGIDLID